MFSLNFKFGINSIIFLQVGTLDYILRGVAEEPVIKTQRLYSFNLSWSTITKWLSLLTSEKFAYVPMIDRSSHGRPHNLPTRATQHQNRNLNPAQNTFMVHGVPQRERTRPTGERSLSTLGLLIYTNILGRVLLCAPVSRTHSWHRAYGRGCSTARGLERKICPKQQHTAGAEADADRPGGPPPTASEQVLI